MTFEKIARMPGLGERWQSPRPHLAELRVWRVEGFEKHTIFYRQVEGGIEVVRVLHGARDVGGILDPQDLA